MTVISRPVLGQQCQSPSGFISGNASTHGDDVNCTGRTPGYWKREQHFGSWTPPYYPTTVGAPDPHTATPFYPLFHDPNSQFPNKTLLDALGAGHGPSGPPYDVARHIVAALLNVAAGWTPVLTIAAVKDIWNEYISKGYFEPTAGIKWDHEQIVDYLLTTMPA